MSSHPSPESVAAVLDRLEIQPKSRLVDPLRPLITVISLLFIISGMFSFFDRTLIDLNSLYFISWLGSYGVAALYLVVGVLAMVGVWRDRWELIVPQQVVLFVVTAGILRMTIIGTATINGQSVPVNWTHSLVSGLSIILLTGFHAVALYAMAFRRGQVYTIAQSEIESLATTIAMAETSKMTLKSAREINDFICQEIVVARQMIELGDFDEQAAKHLDLAFTRSQRLITDLLRSSGLETIPAGEARLEVA